MAHACPHRAVKPDALERVGEACMSTHSEISFGPWSKRASLRNVSPCPKSKAFLTDARGACGCSADLGNTLNIGEVSSLFRTILLFFTALLLLLHYR